MKKYCVNRWIQVLGMAIFALGLSAPEVSARQIMASSWRPPSVLVARSQDQEQARDGVRAGQIVPLSMVLETIRDQYPGKLLDTRTVGGQEGSPLQYEVLWLTPDSRRLDILADAATGKIIRVRGQ